MRYRWLALHGDLCRSGQPGRSDLPGLVEAACRGEDIVIATDGRPLVRLVPVIPRPFRIGLLKDLVGTDPDWFAPLDGDEVDACLKGAKP